ncbi:MAG: adenylate kinase [Myxococcota bacterium]
MADADAQALRLVVLGKPGSGKGTQSQRIAAQDGIPQVSTGDLIRRSIADVTPLGLKCKSFTDKGRLVPDEVVLGMVEERLAMEDCALGFVLDGFPRTLPQAKVLEDWMDSRGIPLSAAINIAVPDSVLVERAVGRRFCLSCGASFHVSFAPPRIEGVCDTCESILQQREDDRAEVVVARVKEYNSKTAPLTEFYRERSLLFEVDGVGSPESVENRIETVLHPVK